MTTPRGTAATAQEQVYNRSSRTPQPPPGWPYNGPKDEPLFVSQSESERSSTHDSEDTLDWPCICGKGHDIRGEWIRCEKSNCRLKWYHLACVDLIIAPPGDWICRECRDRESWNGSKPQSGHALNWPCTCGDHYNPVGGWIRCDKSNCRLKWYHLACVNLSVLPAEPWICRQCRGRMRKLSVAKPDPKKKGIAIKVTPKKGQGRRKSWKELSSDEGEEYKRKVDRSREVKILPGKTRSGAGKDAVYSEEESESTETEKTPQQKTRRSRPKTRSGAGRDAVYSENESESTENEKTPRQKTRSDSPKQTDTTSKDSDELGSYTGWQPAETPGKNWSPYNPERSADMVICHNHEHEIVWDSSEDMILPTNSQYGRTPRTPAPGYDWSPASFEDVWTRDHDMTNADAERGAIEDEPASPANDGSRSSEWETVTDTDETARSSDWETVVDTDGTPRSSDWETIMDTDETADGSGGSTPRFYLMSNSPPVRYSRLTTPEAASTHPSIATTATGEASRARTSGPVAGTDGDQALMAALRESWVGRYFV